MPNDPSYRVTADLSGRERVRLCRAARVQIAGRSVPLGAGAEAAVSPAEAERLVRAGDAVRVHRVAVITKELETPTRGAVLGPIVKSASSGSRRFRAIASTGSLDRHGDIIEPGGWKLDAYRKNPVVCWAHDYALSPIARATHIAVEGQRLMLEAEFPPIGTSARSDEVATLIECGLLGAVSVGLVPLEAEMRRDGFGWRIIEQELVEVSVVPVPANAEALITPSITGQRSATDAGPAYAPSAATTGRLRELARLQRAAGPTPSDLRIAELEQLRREARPDLAARLAQNAKTSGFSRLAQRAADFARTAR